MTGLGLRLQLDRLRRAHKLALPQSITIPLTSSPTNRAQVLVGHAATTTTDLQRQRFRGWCFGAIHRRDPPPLLFKHDVTRGAVGTIQSLSYDTTGALIVTAHVTDQLAARCNAFSVSVTVRDYEIINADRPDFYAWIKSAELHEISLTDVPANSYALVQSRRDVAAMSEFYGHAAAAVANLQKLVTLIGKGVQNESAVG